MRRPVLVCVVAMLLLWLLSLSNGTSIVTGRLPVANWTVQADEQRDDVPHPLTAISELYIGEHEVTLFEHLRTLIEEAAKRHELEDLVAEHFSAVLHDDVRYVHQGRGICTGLQQVVACLMREYAEENDEAPHRKRSETLAHGSLHVIRELTERNHDVRRSSTTLQLDVWFVRTSLHTIPYGDHYAIMGGKRIQTLERMPSVRDPLIVDGQDD